MHSAFAVVGHRRVRIFASQLWDARRQCSPRFENEVRRRDQRCHSGAQLTCVKCVGVCARKAACLRRAILQT